MGKADNFELHNEINTLRMALLDVMRMLDDQQSRDDAGHWDKYGDLARAEGAYSEVGDHDLRP